MKQLNMKSVKPYKELLISYKGYYILLEDSLLGKKFDIIKCVNTRKGWSEIVKADGSYHSFAASMEYGISEKWFVEFSHITYARLRQIGRNTETKK